MRITLSTAMRARDVSRPTDEQLAAAAERETRITRVGRGGGTGAVRGAGGAGPVAPVAPAVAGVAAPNGAAGPAAAPGRTDPPPARGTGRTGEDGSAAGEGAADEVESPTRRRRRRRGR
jgi:hypothetical protein